MDALYLIERDFGKFGIEGSAYREWTRAKIIDLCAFDYHKGSLELGRGESDVIRILEIRMDARPEDITDEIMREADLLRRYWLGSSGENTCAGGNSHCDER